MSDYYAEAVLTFTDRRIWFEAVGPFDSFKKMLDWALAFKHIGASLPEISRSSVVRLHHQPYCSISGEIFAGTLVHQMCQLHELCPKGGSPCSVLFHRPQELN